MNITFETAIFAGLAGTAAAFAIGVVACKNPIRSALCLVINFFVLGFLYFTLNVETLGITQIAVYTGAIMVLFMFVIMLLNLSAPQSLEEKKDLKRPVGIALGVSLAGLLASQIIPAYLDTQAKPVVSGFGTPEVVGRVLFTDYVFPFEAVSFLLLVGIVGSILLAKRRVS